jgi:hypothetical protein
MKQSARLEIIDGEPFITTKSKIYIPSKHIGFVAHYLVHETPTEFWQTPINREITQDEIKMLHRTQKEIFIEMEEYIGDGCGYRLPKLIDDKVLIYISKEN